MGETPLMDMTLAQLCHWHLAHGAPDGRSIRNLREAASKAREECLALLADLAAVGEHTSQTVSTIHTQLMVYDAYEQWAAAQQRSR